MGNTIHIGVFIDGTGNHKDNDEIIGNGTQSNVAKLSKVFEKTPGNENHHIYVSGVGTRSLEELGFKSENGNFKDENGDFYDNRLQGIKEGKDSLTDYYDNIAMGTGLGIRGKGVKDQVNEALYEIKDRIRKIHTINPDAKIEIDIIGFSRGAAASRDLTNELHKQGILNDRVELNTLGLFDSVSSVAMADGNNGDVNVDLDENSAKHIIHYTASDEIRKNFRLESLPGIDKPYTGAHADIGGSNSILDNKEYSIVEGSSQIIQLDYKDIPNKLKELQADAKEQGYGLDYEIHTRKEENQSTIESAYIETREVEFGLSNITLHDMHAQMKEYGVPMTDLSVLGQVTNNTAYSNWEIPQALKENPHDERFVHTSYIDNNRVYPTQDGNYGHILSAKAHSPEESMHRSIDMNDPSKAIHEMTPEEFTQQLDETYQYTQDNTATIRPNYQDVSPAERLANSPEESMQRSIEINEPANAIHEITPQVHANMIDDGYEYQQDSTTTIRPEETYYESGLSIELSSNVEETNEIDTTLKAQEVIDDMNFPQQDNSMDYGMEIGD